MSQYICHQLPKQKGVLPSAQENMEPTPQCGPTTQPWGVPLQCPICLIRDVHLYIREVHLCTKEVQPVSLPNTLPTTLPPPQQPGISPPLTVTHHGRSSGIGGQAAAAARTGEAFTTYQESIAIATATCSNATTANANKDDSTTERETKWPHVPHQEEKSAHQGRSAREIPSHSATAITPKKHAMLHREIRMLHREGRMLHREGWVLHRESRVLHREGWVLHREGRVLYREGCSIPASRG